MKSIQSKPTRENFESSSVFKSMPDCHNLFILAREAFPYLKGLFNKAQIIYPELSVCPWISVDKSVIRNLF